MSTRTRSKILRSFLARVRRQNAVASPCKRPETQGDMALGLGRPWIRRSWKDTAADKRTCDDGRQDHDRAPIGSW